MRSDNVVSIRPRTVVQIVAIVLATVALVWLVAEARRVLVWAFVSLLLAMALSPGVDFLQRHGVRRRGTAAALMYLLVVGVIAGVGALIIPTLVQQIGEFIDAVPGYVRELTAGRGPLGFLERDYHVVERVQDAVSGRGRGGPSPLVGGASTALDVTRSVLTFVAAVVTITFLTLFMLLEGPNWVRAGIELLPEERRPRWQAIVDDVYRMVGRYVSGNLVISLIAGVVATIVLLALGVPFALALGLLVALLDLIPLAGATLAAIVVTLVAFTHSATAGVVVLVFFIVYQQLENHLLQPLIYGRTVRLSPLAILLSVLVGAEVAGVVGALVAIPVGGTLQILLDHWRAANRPPQEPPPPPPEPAGKIRGRPREKRATAAS